MKPSGTWFSERTWSRGLGPYVKKSCRKPRGREARLPPWARPHPRGPLVAPLTDFFRLYMSIYPKNIGEQNRSGVPPPQASVATKNQSGPCSGTLPEGGSLTGGHLHHPSALHDEEGVVHPQGWGYVPVAMCLISLSLLCSWGGTILMYRELCYYSWILWCFSPSTLLNGLSFPFEVTLSDWVFKDLRTLDVCLAWDTHGDNGVLYWFTWYLFWHSTRGFPRWHWVIYA